MLSARGSPGTNGCSSKGKPMTTSFYDLSVPTFLQTVRAVGGFLDRAVVHCAETGADPDEFVDARLFDDMAPFHFQIEAARSEAHTSELPVPNAHPVCRLLLEKKKQPHSYT